VGRRTVLAPGRVGNEKGRRGTSINFRSERGNRSKVRHGLPATTSHTSACALPTNRRICNNPNYRAPFGFSNSSLNDILMTRIPGDKREESAVPRQAPIKPSRATGFSKSRGMGVSIKCSSTSGMAWGQSASLLGGAATGQDENEGMGKEKGNKSQVPYRP